MDGGPAKTALTGLYHESGPGMRGGLVIHAAIALQVDEAIGIDIVDKPADLSAWASITTFKRMVD